MARTANNYTALLSGYTWWGENVVPGKPVFLTYSFETQAYDYLHDDGYSNAYIRSFRPLTGYERGEALNALHQWDDASGIAFLQVPAGQGDIRFGAYDLAKDPDGAGAAAYASYPNTQIGRTWSYSTDQGGDVFLNRTTEFYTRENLRSTFLHEIGHALGLKHPFEGAIRLDGAHDTAENTVMSYDDPFSPVLGPYDLAAGRHLYGLDTQDGHQVASWSWNAHSYTLTQRGGGGADTIRGVATADVIDGKAGNDVILGSGGKDTIRGGLGSDALAGGDDADQFVFDASLTSGYDTLTDFTHGSDKFVLDQSVFTKLSAGPLASSELHVGMSAHDANDRIIYNEYNRTLYYDPDGAGGHAQVRFALIYYGADLTASDFLVVA